jgi:hypothetical protein
LLPLLTSWSLRETRGGSEAFDQDFIQPVSRLLAGHDAELRAAMAFSILSGTTVLRTIIGLESLTQCDRRGVKSKLQALLVMALG